MLDAQEENAAQPQLQSETPPPANTKTKRPKPAFLKATGRLWQRFVSNPIISKEFRKRMRNWRTALSLSLYTGVLGIVGLLVYSATAPRNYGSYYSYSYRSASNAGTSVFIGIIITQLILMAFLVPAFTAGVLTNEKERQTYDILLLTLLRPFDIVFGKLISSLAYILLLVVCSLPITSIAFLLGGVGLDQLLIGLLVCVVTALFFGTCGIFWSAVTSTTGRSIRNTIFTVLVIVIGLPLLGWFFAISSASAYSTSNYIAILTLLFFVSFNPVVAITVTTVTLNSSSSAARNLFFFEISSSYYPQPWLIFMAIAITTTVILFIFTVRMVRPINAAEGNRRAISAKAAAKFK